MRTSSCPPRFDGSIVRGLLIGLPLSATLWYALARTALALTGGL